MTTYKLICCDLDRTLLNSKKHIDDVTLDVLKTLHDEGIHIAITTGRALFDAKRHAGLIGPDTFYMGSNGAVIGYMDKIIYESIMSQEHKSKLIELMTTHMVKPIIVTDEHIYICKKGHYIFHKLFYRRGQNKEYLKYIADEKEFRSIITAKDTKIHKVILFPFFKSKVKHIKEAVNDLELFELAITPGHIFEITGKDTSKGSGVKALIDYLDIDMKQVIAFGDSQNDAEMLKIAGCGVAMDNASDAIKSLADRVTSSNDKQGVAKVLKEIYSK